MDHRSINRSINEKGTNRQKVFIRGVSLFFRYTAAAERAAEMPRHPDGGASRHRGGASGFFSKESRARARLQQISRQVGQKHTAQTQGAKTKVTHLAFLCDLFLSFTQPPRSMIYIELVSVSCIRVLKKCNLMSYFSRRVSLIFFDVRLGILHCYIRNRPVKCYLVSKLMANNSIDESIGPYSQVTLAGSNLSTRPSP